MKSKKEKAASFSTDTRLAGRLKNKRLVDDLDQNLALIKSEFEDVDLIQYRNLSVTMNRKPKKLCFIFTDGVVNSEIIDRFVIKPLMSSPLVDQSGDCVQYLMEQVTGALSRGVKNFVYG